MRPDGPRDPTAGPDGGPEAPFPIKLWGPVIRGFGRGSKELGIPTANIPPEGLSAYPNIKSGVYYGFIGLSQNANSSDAKTYPAVLSIGTNPFYKNTKRSVEIHVLQKFHSDFYGASLTLLMLGFIRPEYDYVSKESLIEDIMVDCEVARKSLDREKYRTFERDAWLMDFSWARSTDVKEAEKEVLGTDISSK